MFKEALGALSSSLVGAVKDTASEYTPTAKNMGGAFSRIAQQGIANLSFRSPILADMAATMLHSFQMELGHRDSIRQHTKSKEADEFRDEIKSRLGDGADSDKVESEMIKVIQKMEKIIDKEGDKAKDNKFYQDNEKFYKQFLEKITPKKTPTGAPGTSGTDDMSPEVLTRIETNTSHTAQILAQIQELGGLSSGEKSAEPGQSPKQTQGMGFVDPYTGLPSIRAAIGGIGGQFLSKVFDDATLEKYAGKARRRMGLESKEQVAIPDVQPAKRDDITDLTAPVATVKTMPREKRAETHEQSVASILKDVSLDLTDVNSTTEDSREGDSKDNRRHAEVKTLQEQTVQQLQILNEMTEKKEETTGGILGSLKNMVGQFMPMIGKIAPMLSGVGSVLMRVAPVVGAVAVAGGAGYAVGSVAKDAIDTGISKATGKEETLGGWLYDLTHDDPLAEKKTPVSNRPTHKATAIERAETAIAKSAASAKTQSNANPVVLNNNTNNNSNTTVVVGSKVRNDESTFERVQSTNFWSPL